VINKQSGITLIELMIAIVMLAILATIALPTYSEYVIRNKLTTVPAQLLDLRLRMEQVYQDNRSYLDPGNIANCAIAAPVSDNFSYACSNQTRTTYTWTATNNVNSGLGDAADYTYSINEMGDIATTKFAGNNAADTCVRLSSSQAC